MKGADLPRAAALIAERDALERLRARLKAGEGLHLILGAGSAASEIVLSPDYRAEITRDVSFALEARSGQIGATLTALGVDP